MARVWTCRTMHHGVRCGLRWPGTTQRCTCGGMRPKRRKPQHQAVLEVPYARWVEEFGEVCNICGRPASEGRRLDRDHSHKSGMALGVLCHLCNRALPVWVTPEWLRLAAAYLERPPVDLLAEPCDPA
jgi:hypothetical protein